MESRSEKKHYLRGVSYTGSFPDFNSCPRGDRRPVVALTGRSNSGKSSLLSALCDHKNLARTSKKAGKTRQLNYFAVPQGEFYPEFYLVDMPGFGYAEISHGERNRLRRLCDDYLLREERIVLLLLVLDARRDLGDEERNILKHCRAIERNVLLVRTKWDRMKRREQEQARRLWQETELTEKSLPVSSTKKTGIDSVLRELERYLAAAAGAES